MLYSKYKDKKNRAFFFKNEKSKLVRKFLFVNLINNLNLKKNSELFKQCRALADSLQLPDCSMGMSGDWEEAIEAGSTWLRLGSLIFGYRS